jgi:UDP-N-acetylmuramate dehydrogenase
MKIDTNKYLSEMTTTGIGGLVSLVFWPTNHPELIEALRFCNDRKMPFFVLAGGSNTIFPDDKLVYSQAVINIKEFNTFEIKEQDGKTIFELDPGMELQKMVDLAMEQGLAGAVGLNRVPGTIGGAVVGNAGAYGTETKDIVQKIEFIRLSEVKKQPDWINIYSLENSECFFGYRDSLFKQDKDILITRIYLEFTKSKDIEADKIKYDEITTKRDEIYPKGFQSPGSLFKNILFSTLPKEVQKNIPADWVVFGDKLPVGKLLENIDAKGFQIGQMKQRETHANIMTNLGGGTFADANKIVTELQKKVYAKFGIEIEPEVRFIPKNFREFFESN